jgi:hypothetical protein
VPGAIHDTDQAFDRVTVEGRLAFVAAVWELTEDDTEVVRTHRKESLERDLLADKLARFQTLEHVPVLSARRDSNLNGGNGQVSRA